MPVAREHGDNGVIGAWPCAEVDGVAGDHAVGKHVLRVGKGPFGICLDNVGKVKEGEIELEYLLMRAAGKRASLRSVLAQPQSMAVAAEVDLAAAVGGRTPINLVGFVEYAGGFKLGYVEFKAQRGVFSAKGRIQHGEYDVELGHVAPAALEFRGDGFCAVNGDKLDRMA